MTTDDAFHWHVRVRDTGPDASRAYARTHAVDVGAQASFHDSDALPSAIEVALAALGGDLLHGWQVHARRAGVEIHALEAALSARLDNPLVHLGVVGEEGTPGIAEVRGVIYVGSSDDPTSLLAVWRKVTARSPLFTTLARCTRVDVRLEVTP